MPATAEPPASPQVTIVSSAPPAPPPKPTSTIRAAEMTPTEPTLVAKPSPGWERMRGALNKKAGIETPPPEPAESPSPAPSPDGGPKPGDAPPGGPETPPGASPETEVAPPEGAPAPKDGKKVSPWRIADAWKQKAAELEKSLAEAKTSALPEKEKTEFLGRIEQLQKKLAEYEDEMRFVNYEKSPEFTQKYDEPYQKAWQAAMAEMSELQVADPATGGTRPVAAQDLLNLVNLPLQEARKVANELYGDFADDVMAHRKEIKNLFAARASALEDAKKTGAARDKERAQMAQAHQAQATDLIKKTWEKANAAAVTDPENGKYFTPVEGDQEGNQRLAKGFELVDRALAENPFDPKLTPEQRAAVVQRHAAVRNRAAAFGRLKAHLTKAESRIAELTKELEQFKASTPPTTTTPQPTAEPTDQTGWGRVRAGLAARAH
jgi:hypothetical protein